MGGFRHDEAAAQHAFIEQIRPIIGQLVANTSPHADDFVQARQAVQEAIDAQSAELLASREATLKGRTDRCWE